MRLASIFCLMLVTSCMAPDESLIEGYFLTNDDSGYVLIIQDKKVYFGDSLVNSDGYAIEGTAKDIPHIDENCADLGQFVLSNSPSITKCGKWDIEYTKRPNGWTGRVHCVDESLEVCRDIGKGSEIFTIEIINGEILSFTLFPESLEPLQFYRMNTDDAPKIR